MPKDRVTQTHQGYGFVEFMGEDDADYAIKIMNMIKMYGKPIRVNKVNRLYIVLYFELCLVCQITLMCVISNKSTKVRISLIIYLWA